MPGFLAMAVGDGYSYGVWKSRAAVWKCSDGVWKCMLNPSTTLAILFRAVVEGVSKIQMRSFIVIFWRSLVILSVAKNLITCALYFCWHLQILHFVQNDRDRRYFDTSPFSYSELSMQTSCKQDILSCPPVLGGTSEAEGVREGESEGASFSFTPFSNKSRTSNSFLFRGSNALCNEWNSA